MHEIAQHWAPDLILLSYIISVTGSYCTIQLMEQWRLQESVRGKYLLLLLSAIALGGCGIWCMHFTGMTAMKMTLEDSTVLEVHFEGGLTIISLIFPILGVFVGLKVASTDPFFLEIEASRRKELLTKNLQTMTMDQVLKREAVSRKIKFTALFSRLWRILGGGLFAALGVLGMHYLGMMAQRTNAAMELDPGIITLSSVIAFVTANAAFWILFRALTFWPNFETLRLGSAFIMGVAVCGTHYVGMFAATYTYSEENYAEQTRFLFMGETAGTIASHGSLLLCFWMSTFAVVVSLRKDAQSMRSGKSAVHPTTQKSKNPSQMPQRLQTGGASQHSQFDAGSKGPNASQIDNGSKGPKEAAERGATKLTVRA